MNLSSAFQLLILAAIWGASFIFMRIAVPVLGPTLLIELRVGLAAVFLLLAAFYLKKNLQILAHWRHYFFLGLFNSAIPFLLFAYSAQVLTASLLSILNSTAPIWGTVIGALWFRSKISIRQLIGLLTGVAGVVILLGFDDIRLLDGSTLAIVASLGAALCYGISSVYARASAIKQPFNNAHGSMWAATLIILPLIPFFPASSEPTTEVIGSVVLLGVLCTGIAYLMYFRLIDEVGAPSALSVTFLIPMFGIFWGYIFLDEQIGWHTLMGTVLVITGTIFVTGFSLRKSLFPKAFSHE